MVMGQSELVISVTEKEFEKEVLERSKQAAVVVDFWAPWCGPCRALTPVLERLVAERKGEVVLAKVNIDEEQGLAAAFGISSIPAVIGFRHGRAVLDFVGLLPEDQIRKFLDQVSPTEAERNAQRGADLEKSNPAQALGLYLTALQRDANNEEALLGLSRIYISQNRDAEAAELLDRLGPGSEHGDEVEKLTALLWLRQHARDMGEEGSLRQRLNANPKDAVSRYQLGCVVAVQGKPAEALELLLSAAELDPKLATEKVREAMVKVFQVVGVQSPLANDYRNKLAALLY